MRSEIEYETNRGLATRSGVIAKDADLLFATSYGGDLHIEAGDTVVITVLSCDLARASHDSAKARKKFKRGKSV